MAEIKQIAHLIPLELEESWLINNRMDFETWNTMDD